MKPFKIIELDTVDSTNNYLKKMAKSGAENFTVVISKSQSSGKGTHKRSFISKEGGVYLSILLETNLRDFNATLITPMTAVAVSDSITQISGKNPMIKWVNDIYLENKKVCGILCESIVSTKTGKRYIIVGIGVNLFKPSPDFDEEIREIAGSIFENFDKNIKNQFIYDLLEKFYFYYENLQEKSFLEKYRTDNFILGKKIKFSIEGRLYTATALEIDDDCRLVVELSDKSKITLTSCDIFLDL